MSIAVVHGGSLQQQVMSQWDTDVKTAFTGVAHGEFTKWIKGGEIP